MNMLTKPRAQTPLEIARRFEIAAARTFMENL